MRLEETLTLLKEYLKTSKDLSMLLEGSGSFIKCYNKKTHRLHGKLDTLGANTSRCTHRAPNLTQTPRDQAFRELLTVPKGRVLIDVDADALELVMLGHYLGQFDNYEFAKIVDTGDKRLGTDIHTVNQHRVNLPTRDSAKTFIYSVIYGAGNTKVGHTLWDFTPFKYSKTEFTQAKEAVEKRVVKIGDKEYFPIAKDSLIPYSNNLIMQTIFGTRVTTLFRDNTKGYKELLNYCIASVKDKKIKGLDERLLNLRSEHKALNLYLQSAGAIFMKYLAVHIDRQLSTKYVNGEDFGYVANIHDAINIECNPDIAQDICTVLRQSFLDTSHLLNLKYPVKGNPKIGKNQWETH